jgi:hypothetical protein
MRHGPARVKLDEASRRKVRMLGETERGADVENRERRNQNIATNRRASIGARVRAESSVRGSA